MTEQMIALDKRVEKTEKTRFQRLWAEAEARSADNVELDAESELSAADQLEKYFEEDAARLRAQWHGDAG
jgi:hypothetical protein